MSEFTDLEKLKQEVENLKKILITFIHTTFRAYEDIHDDEVDWYEGVNELNSKYRELDYVAIDLLENNNIDKCYDKYITYMEIANPGILLKLWDKNKKYPDADYRIWKKNFKESEMNMERFKTENPEEYNEYIQQLQQMDEQEKLKNIRIRQEKQQKKAQEKAQEEERIKRQKERDEERKKREEEETNVYAVGGRKTRKNRKSKKNLEKYKELGSNYTLTCHGM
jgi:hypothetical protein